jgi:hypothetical protein
VGLIDNAINRDLEAQKAEHDAALKKGQLGLEEANNTFSAHRQIFKDDVSALDSARTSLHEWAAAKMAEAAAKTSEPMAKARLLQGVAAINEAEQARKDKRIDAGTENYVKLGHLRVEESKVALEALKAKNGPTTFVAHGFYSTDPVPEPDLKAWRDEHGEIQTMRSSANTLVSFLRDFTPGKLLPSAELGRAQQAALALLPQMNNSEGVTRFTDTDKRMWEEISKNPATFANLSSSVREQQMGKINGLIESLAQAHLRKSARLGIHRDARVSDEEAGEVSATGQATPAQGARRVLRDTTTGKMYVRNPDGSAGEEIR